MSSVFMGGVLADDLFEGCVLAGGVFGVVFMCTVVPGAVLVRAVPEGIAFRGIVVVHPSLAGRVRLCGDDGRDWRRGGGSGWRRGSDRHREAGLGQKVTGLDLREFFHFGPASGVQHPGEAETILQVGGRPFTIDLVLLFQAVDVPAQLGHGQHLVIVLKSAVFGLVHLEGAKVQDLRVFLKAHPDEIVGRGHPVPLAFLVEPSVLKNEHQRVFVRGDHHLALFRDDDIILLARVVLLVDHHAADGGVVLFFFPDLDDIAFDLIVEDALFDVEGGLADDDVVFQRIHLQVSHRDDVVVEEEGDIADDERDEEQGPHKAQEGDPCRLDGDELEGLAQVAQGHDGGQQHCQGEGQGHQRSADIQDQPGYRDHVHALAHDVVDVQPEELQHQYEEGDEEGGDERPDKGLYDQQIQFFDRTFRHRNYAW